MVHKVAAQTPEPASGLFGPDAESGSGDIAVQFLNTPAEFARLAPEWNRIHAQAAAASVFNSWLWQYQWWQVYGGDQPLRILVALRHGAAVGILALYIQKTTILGVPVRIVRFVGTGADTHPDDVGPVILPGLEEPVATTFAHAVLRLSQVDVVLLSDIESQSNFAPALERAAKQAGRASLNEVCERIAFVELPRSWPLYLQSLTSDRRTRLNSARRKVTAAHRVRFFVWQDAAGLDRAVDCLAELHRSRWRQAGGSDSFASAQYIEFHRGIIKSAFARGWLRLYCLELDGEIAAMTYCYRFRNRVYLMQAGFDPALAKANPGKVLLGHALEHAIGEGNTVFDFLRGEHRYKDQLATGYRTTLGIRVFHNTLGALAYRLRRIWLPLLKASLYGRSPPKLRS